jgi:hypothetical protein
MLWKKIVSASRKCGELNTATGTGLREGIEITISSSRSSFSPFASLSTPQAQEMQKVSCQPSAVSRRSNPELPLDVIPRAFRSEESAVLSSGRQAGCVWTAEDPYLKRQLSKPCFSQRARKLARATSSSSEQARAVAKSRFATACSMRFTIAFSLSSASRISAGRFSDVSSSVGVGEYSCDVRFKASRTDSRRTPRSCKISAARDFFSRSSPSNKCSVRIGLLEPRSASSAAKASTRLHSSLIGRSTGRGIC